MAALYDVIVIGAGPGGATAAYFLGEAGKRVLVLEKEILPLGHSQGGPSLGGHWRVAPQAERAASYSGRIASIGLGETGHLALPPGAEIG